MCGAALRRHHPAASGWRLLLIALEVYLLARVVFRGRSAPVISGKLLQAAVIVAVIALLPLAPWAWRNWQVFHRFQPLAPRYANEEDEFVPMGFNHWTKTWIADYASVEEIYWAVPGSRSMLTFCLHEPSTLRSNEQKPAS